MKPATVSKKCVLVHGGAGKLRSDTDLKLPFLAQAADAAWDALDAGEEGETAVVAALRVLEDCEYFNAGYGGYPNNKGIVLLDVGLMRGNREFVSILNARKMKYPSEVALDLLRERRFAMSVWTHELMQWVESSSEEVKQRYGLVASHEALVAPYVKDLLAKRKAELASDEGKGTVGCLVRDASGRLFAGTSTGGVSFKSNGRIGDTPIIGAGVYADDAIGALSTSGHGEAVLANCFSGLLLAQLRQALSQNPECFVQSPDALERLTLNELREFAAKSPDRCVGVIIAPPRGRPWCGVYGGTFAVGMREEGDSKASSALLSPSI